MYVKMLGTPLTPLLQEKKLLGRASPWDEMGWTRGGHNSELLRLGSTGSSNAIHGGCFEKAHQTYGHFLLHFSSCLE